ncbi:MAG: helix-turn-helix transcriptional regulator [Acidobacteria bacterium]|nr:helix-turn-helix transcriptional regulator [Acidobacteriota bacterium]MCL5288283.1 helix-turn-helix transcriptional regulator [Acidobacteriota bacterium]
MNGQDFKAARQARGWTQVEAAKRLGLSQPYVAMLERGQRRLTPRLARKAVRVLRLPPTALPLSEPPYPPARTDPQVLAEELAALGYPGFAYLQGRRGRKNPAELLLAALAQENLEARQAEALPWLMLKFWDSDNEWLVRNAKLRDLQNRLGFVVTLSRQVAEREGTTGPKVQALQNLEAALALSKLAREDTFCQAWLSNRLREWERQNRSDEAVRWNLLTSWKAEDLRYVV